MNKSEFETADWEVILLGVSVVTTNSARAGRAQSTEATLWNT
jgi:hypothetical protein